MNSFVKIKCESKDKLYCIPFWQLDTNDNGKPVKKLWIIVQKLVWTLQE